MNEADAGRRGAQVKTTCGYCGVEVRPSNLQRHFASHFKPTASGFFPADLARYMLAKKRAEMNRLSAELSWWYDATKLAEDLERPYDEGTPAP